MPVGKIRTIFIWQCLQTELISLPVVSLVSREIQPYVTGICVLVFAQAAKWAVLLAELYLGF